MLCIYQSTFLDSVPILSVHTRTICTDEAAFADLKNNPILEKTNKPNNPLKKCFIKDLFVIKILSIIAIYTQVFLFLFLFYDQTSQEFCP